MHVYLSGICKYPKCDKPSVAEGCCAFHYNIEKQKESTKLQTSIVGLLKSMNDRLDCIEQRLKSPLINQASTNIDHTYSNIPKQDIIPSNEMSKKNKPKSSMFIPSVETMNVETNIKDVKKCQTSKNIRNLAHRLNIASQEE